MSPKTEMLLAALRQENNRYLAAIANVSAVVGELAEAVEVLQRQLGGCNVAATQALRVAGGADIAGELSTVMWMLVGIGLLLLVKSPVMSMMLFAWGCLDGSGWRGVSSVLLCFRWTRWGLWRLLGFKFGKLLTSWLRNGCSAGELLLVAALEFPVLFRLVRWI